MPPLPTIAHVYRVSIDHFDGAGASTSNVIHVQNNADPTPAALFAILDSHMTTSCWGELSDTFGGCNVTITPLDGASSSATFPTPSGNWAGESSGQRIPEAAFGLTFTTGLRGRRNRGRMFIGPVTETQASDGQLNPTGVTAATAAWGTFTNDLVSDASSTALVVASYVGRVAHQVTNVRGHTSVHTQRRRLLRTRSD